MRDIKTSFYEDVIYPIYRLGDGPLYGANTIKTYRELKRLQWLPESEIRKYQHNKLRKLIQHVYDNVPYYRNVMCRLGMKPADIQNTDDLKNLPFLTKNIIRENFEDIMFKGMNKRTVKKGSTSGTTGKRLTLYRDRNSRIWEHAALLRGWSWAHYNIGDTLINITTHEKKSMWGKTIPRLIHSYFFSVFANEDQILENARKIKSLNPACVSGYTSSLYVIANLIRKYNLTGIRIPVILSCAEMLHDYQRTFIEDSFKGKIYDFYGSNEVGSLAYECEYNCKHITDEHVIVETTNSRGDNVTDTPGDIILTDLDNYAMPFIRYKIGDVGTLTNHACECRRELSLLKSIDGRSQEFLKTLDGNYVPGIYFPPLFRQFKGIEQFQIIQPDINHVTLKFVKNNSFNPLELEKMTRMIRDKIGNDVIVNLEQCDHIPLTSSGKTRLVISSLPIEC